MPLPQALLADSHRLRRSGERVTLVHDQADRILLELPQKTPAASAALLTSSGSSFGPPLGTIIWLPPVSESPGLSHPCQCTE